MAMKRCYEELLRAGVLGEYKSLVPLRRRNLEFYDDLNNSRA